jgi:acyl-CoA synthetase (AMP-forming)/AMP-acid ligase II
VDLLGGGGRPVGWILDEAAAIDPGRPALVLAGQSTGYGELSAAVDRCAEGLLAHGVRPGWRVPLVDDASVLSVASLVALARVGASAALMNPRLTSGELEDMRLAAGAAPVGIAGPPYAEALAATGGERVLGADDLLAEPGRGGTDPGAPGGAAGGPGGRGAGADPDDDAVVLFTSGTTGTPKAVPLSHGLLGPRVAAYAPRADPQPSVSLMCVPLVHVGGMLGMLVALGRGSTTVVQTRFDAGEWLALVERHRVTTAFVVPTMLHRILDHPAFERSDLSSLVALSYGATPASTDLVRRAMKLLPGVALTNTFGQTETLGSITALGPGDHTPERLASVGRPLPGVTVRVVDPASGRPVPRGAVGELWVQAGGGVAVGGPAGPDGWLRTGDLVSEDREGYLYPAGRLVDVINRGGEKFAPAEVEEALRAHEAVRDVAVVGVPDPEMGSRVGAAVVAREEVTVGELRDHCRGRIANFKLPEVVVLVDELPYNDFGKVDRRALRELLAGGVG